MSTNVLRPEKGNSIIAIPDDYTVIDIETTGLDPAYCDIIEVSALRIRNGQISDTFTSLIRPTPYYSIDIDTGLKTLVYVDQFITDLTGITNEMLASAPEASDVIPSFSAFIGSDILDGHNTHYDINFLYDAFLSVMGAPLRNDFIDNIRLSRKLFPGHDHHRLVDTTAYCGIQFEKQHRAQSDCMQTFACFEAMKKLISEKYSSFSEFSRLYKQNNNHAHFDYSTLTAATDVFDEDHPFYQKQVVFTGALTNLIRSEAMQLVLNVGGKVSDSLTKDTNYLVVGTSDYIDSSKGKKTSKLQKAEKYMLKGCDIQIISESVFLNMLNEN